MSRFFLILTLIASTVAIRVPVDNKDVSVSEEDDKSKTQKPVYYESDTDVDSYLIPPSPHKPHDDGPDTLPTYLVPPAEHSHNEFYQMSEDEQTAWLPITPPANIHPLRLKNKSNLEPNTEISKIRAPSAELEPPIKEASVFNLHKKPPGVNVKHNFRLAEVKLSSGISNTDLEQELTQAVLKQVHKVPRPDKVNGPVPSTELQTPKLEYVTYRAEPLEPTRTLALRLTPPSPLPQLQPIKLNILTKPYPNPTRLFPKKHTEFKRIPIPISLYAPEYKAFPEIEQHDTATAQYSEKNIFQYEEAEKKRQWKKKNKSRQEEPEEFDSAVELEQSPNRTGLEQEASESNFRIPEQRQYPVRFLPHAQPNYQPVTTTSEAPAPKERTEFRMHGMKGPHSYQFGYDTGKGFLLMYKNTIPLLKNKNRQFRFEERDNDGKVRGHYGYMDRSGKLRVFNYNADPDTGFHSEAQEPTT